MLAGFLACTFTLSASALEITRFVKPGGTGKGTSWADACGSINQALDAIKTAGSGTVYIGPGNYTESVYVPDGSKKVNMLGGYSENNMEKPERDKVFITEGPYDIRKNVSAAIEVGWRTEDIRISCINVVKGNTGIHLRGENNYADSCNVSGCKTGIMNEALSKKIFVRYCTVSNCSSCGMKLWNANIWFSTIKGNSLGMYLEGCLVWCCQVVDNVHVSQTRGFASDAGGMRICQTTVHRSTIMNNSCDGNGGGLYVGGSGYHSFIFQCVIANNTARDGGGIYADEQIYIESATIINNKAARMGGGICIGKSGWDKASAMTGSILWNNFANGVLQQYGINGNKAFNMTHSAIQGGGLLPETDVENGIIDVSPQNVDASKPSIALTKVVTFSGSSTTPEQAKQIHEQDFRITAQSACIDKGGDFSNVIINTFTNSKLNADRTKDKDFNLRNDGKYDIGAYEFQQSQ